MFLEKIHASYGSLNDTDRHILSVITRHFEKIPQMGVEELASLCNTSRTSILRVSKKLGFSGFSEMKNFIKWDIENPAHQMKIDAMTSIKDETTYTLTEFNSNNHVSDIIQKIDSAKRIFIYGSGEAQRNCANEMQRLFMQVGKYMIVVKASNEFLLLAKELNEDDLVFIISLSGDIIKFEKGLHMLKLSHTTLVSITNLDNNVLATEATYRLYAATTPIQIKDNLVHNSFVSYFVVVESLFRDYIEFTDLI